MNWKAQKEQLPANGTYNATKTLKVFTQKNILKIYNLRQRTVADIIELPGTISTPIFLEDENKIAFQYENNAYIFNRSSGKLTKITRIVQEMPQNKNLRTFLKKTNG